jgi:hypothetical protein
MAFKSVKLSEETYDAILQLQAVLVRKGTSVLPERVRPARPSFDGIVKVAIRALRQQVK